MDKTVQAIGEQGLLRLVQRFCPSDIVGDDAAVLPTQPDRDLVVTTDVLIDNVHFSDRTTPAHAAGWRAIAANLSDLAAMGARPIGVTIGLGLPGETSVDWVSNLYQGMTDCLGEFGGAIVGGDLVRSPVRTISITAFGEVEPGKVIARSIAQPGDAILVTGYHGSARAGLELLLNEEFDPQFAALIKAHQYPTPQLAIPPKLTGRTAGMDSSDGLADAVLQICRSSHVGAELWRSQLPIHPVLQTYKPEQAIQWALYGGEDFELVLCMPRTEAKKLLPQLPEEAAIVGKITDTNVVELIDESGQREVLSFDRGFQHFQQASGED
jgi:thiamine-monophosphate kinase